MRILIFLLVVHAFTLKLLNLSFSDLNLKDSFFIKLLSGYVDFWLKNLCAIGNTFWFKCFDLLRQLYTKAIKIYLLYDKTIC